MTDATQQRLLEAAEEIFGEKGFKALSGVLRELLHDVPELKSRLVAFSIVGQCLFYRIHRPIAAMLVGEEEFEKYDVDLVASHITAFTLNALGLEEKSADAVMCSTTSATGVEP